MIWISDCIHPNPAAMSGKSNDIKYAIFPELYSVFFPSFGFNVKTVFLAHFHKFYKLSNLMTSFHSCYLVFDVSDIVCKGF